MSEEEEDAGPEISYPEDWAPALVIFLILIEHAILLQSLIQH